jgi:hypothetical protein
MLRRILTPEDKLAEKVRTQTTTTTIVSRDTIDELESICQDYGGKQITPRPKTPEPTTPTKPPAEIPKEVKQKIAELADLKNPPPDTLTSFEDYEKLRRRDRIEICKTVLGDITIIDELRIEDNEVKQTFDNLYESAKLDIAEKRRKHVTELTTTELKRAEKTATEMTYLVVCGSRIKKYFDQLSRPDILETYLEPEPEKKPIEKIKCTQENPTWEDMTEAITKICETARKHIIERREPFYFEVEANHKRRKGEFIQVIDEAFPNIADPRRVPSHRVTIKMVIDAKIRVPKEKIRDAIKYIKEYRPEAWGSIKTHKDLERELILTMLWRVRRRLEDVIRAGCAPDVQEEIQSLHPKQITLFKEIARTIESAISAQPPTLKEEERIKRGLEEARKEIASTFERLFELREEELRKLYAEMTAFRAIQVAGKTLFEALPTEPVCPPKIMIDITKRKEKEVVPPTLITAGWRIVDEWKYLEVEIEVEQLEIKIIFCTPWCRAIACVLKNITPDYVIDKLLEEAKRLKFVEVIIPSPSP